YPSGRYGLEGVAHTQLHPPAGVVKERTERVSVTSIIQPQVAGRTEDAAVVGVIPATQLEQIRRGIRHSAAHAPILVDQVQHVDYVQRDLGALRVDCRHAERESRVEAILPRLAAGVAPDDLSAVL